MNGPRSFFNLEILRHQFGNDLVLMADGRLQARKFLAILRGLWATFIGIKNGLGVEEELSLPGIELSRRDGELLANRGVLLACDKVTFEDLRLIRGAKASPGFRCWFLHFSWW
jgi:hypothetical protein